MQRKHVLVLIRVYQPFSPRWFQQHEEMPVQNRPPLGTLTNIRIWSDVCTNIAIPIKLVHPRVIHQKKKKKSCTLQILQSWPKLSHWCSHFRFSQCMGKWRPGHRLPGVSHLLRSNEGDRWPVTETMAYLASALSRVTTPSVAALPWGEGKQQSVRKLLR